MMDRLLTRPVRRLVGMLLLPVAAAGCQVDGPYSDRPLLPLILPAAVAEPAPRRIALGSPLDSAAAGKLIQVAHVFQGPADELTPSAITSCFISDQVIDLPTALRIANLDNPAIGIAEQIVQANQADQLAARAMLFPNLNLGANYSMVNGPVLASSGKIFNDQRQSIYFGAGAYARVAGTVEIPGMMIQAHLGDAYFAPRVAEQRVVSSQFDSAATRNSVLLDVAKAYLALVGAEARLLAYRQSELEFLVVAKLTDNFATKGQGLESDAKRARSDLLLLRSSAQKVEEDIVFWSTELSRLLNTDPSVRLRPEAGTPPLIQLVDKDATLESLVATATAQRPELAARNADVSMNETRLRQERVRPFVPTIMVGLSEGQFGGGSSGVGYHLGNINTRFDMDFLAVWTLKNLGVGNRAIQRAVRAQVGQAEAARNFTSNLVRTEVAEALAATNTARSQMEIDRRQVQTSLQAYQEDLERARNLKGHPIEVLNSLHLLAEARQALVRSMVAYSQSQFGLYAALGGIPFVPEDGANGKK